jgi:hypothetical protein
MSIVNEKILKLCPNLEKALSKSKSKPTPEQRIEALEHAVAELAIQQTMMEVSE